MRACEKLLCISVFDAVLELLLWLLLWLNDAELLTTFEKLNVANAADPS